MLRKLGAFFVGAVMFFSISCEGILEIEFSWNASIDASWFGNSLNGAEACDNGTELNVVSSKQVEITLPIPIGNADGIEDEDIEVTLTHRWGTDASTQDSMTEPAAGTLGQSRQIVADPSYYIRKSDTIDVVFKVTLQGGWNELQASYDLEVCNAKRECQTETNTEDAQFVFLAVGGVIPLKVQLDWAEFGADMDLVIREEAAGASEQFVYWNINGYDGVTCLSAPDCGPASGSACDPCFLEDYYTVGRDRRSGFSFGSLDTDDQARGGPEVYTVDPEEAVECNTTTQIVPRDYADGDSIRVYAVYYSADPKMIRTDGETDANGVVSIFVNGSETPLCYRTGAITEANNVSDLDDQLDADATSYSEAIGMGNYFEPTDGSMVFVGEVNYTDAMGWMWDDSNGQGTSFTATNGICAVN